MLASPARLHIPDGFLTPLVAAAGWVLALVMIAVALRQTRNQLGERQVPLMGVLAAFIFAAQAINFPVAAGTSGHLMGGALAAILLGPWAGALIMTAVIAVQAILFQDGGLLVMGWNIMNMGVFATFTGYAAYRLMRILIGEGPGSKAAGAFLGAWLSVEIGAVATAFELAASGTTPLNLALPAMAGVHALIGLGEAVITTTAVGFLQLSMPQILVVGEQAPGKRGAAFVVGGTALALFVSALAPLASPSPDGLESVADQHGFLAQASGSLFQVLPDYTIPIISSPALTTLVAVAAGTIVVLLVGVIIGKATARRHQAEG